MRNGLAVGTLACALVVTGCAQIPQAAIDVNRQVSTGIVALGDNGRELVRAWEETAYKLLDERWSQVYARADATFRARRGVPSGAALSARQHEDVAGLAVLIRDRVRVNIRTEADRLRGLVAANTKATLAANDSITQLLVSAQAVGASGQSALLQVGNLVPVPPDVVRFVDQALASIDD